MSIHDVAHETGVSVPYLRYLVAKGHVPRPGGTRARTYWGKEHVRAVQRHQSLRKAGHPPSAIPKLLKGQADVSLSIDSGVTLLLSPTLLGSGQEAWACPI